MRKLIHLPVLCLMASIMASHAQSVGCNANIGSRPDQTFQLINSSGSQSIDAFVSRDLGVLRVYFKVNPSFYYYNDGESPNAQAMPTVEDSRYPDGTIIFGMSMLQKEFNTSKDGTTIPLLMAHEAAHILDDKYNIVTSYPTITRELFADYMAGTFLRYRSILVGTNTEAVLYSFFSKGDSEFNNPDHHGTANERLDAVVSGYRWLEAQDKSGRKVGLNDIVNAAKNYLGVKSSLTTGSRSSPSSATTGRARTGSANNRVSIRNTDSNNTPINGGFLYEGQYSIHNLSDQKVRVVVKLPYGYYENCNAASTNFRLQGYETTELDLDPGETQKLSMRKELYGQCAGVNAVTKEATYEE